MGAFQLRFRAAAALLLAPFACVAAPASETLAPAAVEPADIVAELRVKFAMEGVESAIASGFLRIAAHLLNQLMARTDLAEMDRLHLMEQRLRIALATGNAAMALDAMDQLASGGRSVPPLLAAMAAYLNHSVDSAEQLLDELDLSSLTPEDVAWFEFVRALVYFRQGRVELADESFRVAAAIAPSALIRVHFELIRLREEFSSRRADADAISALRETVRFFRGERSGMEAARLLAIALDGRGDKEDAIAVLNQQITDGGLATFGLRADFLLLLGQIAGADSTRGQLALRQLLNESAPTETHALALTLLVEGAVSVAQRTALIADINTWLNAVPGMRMPDRLLVYGAHLAAIDGSFDAAEAFAQRLLSRFPESAHIADALRILAYIAWMRNPPQYRTAADFLNQLRQLIPEGPRRARTTLLMADAFFLNEDFASASDAYGAALLEPGLMLPGNPLFQRVNAEIALGRLAQAAHVLDAAHGDSRFDVLSLWKAEWNLLHQLRASGSAEVAFTRIERLLEGAAGGAAVPPPELLLRFKWLHTRLLFDAGRYADSLQAANRLRAALQAPPYVSLDAALLQLLQGHLILLIGENLLGMGRVAEAGQAFTELRMLQPESGPAILSFLVESRMASGDERLMGAQRSLLELADRFPNSPYAPIALWEAALTVEQTGLNVHLQEAISILENLITRYPDNPLVFYARLKQGDLARRLNDFSSALLLYDRALQMFPEHPDRFRVELSRADTLMGLASSDPSRMDAAAVLYERNTLIPTVPVPVRIEAGYKWARAMRQQGELDNFESTLWLVYTRLILDPNLQSRLFSEPGGRYWSARLLLEFAEYLAASGRASRAREVYQQHINFNLPAADLARARLDALP